MQDVEQIRLYPRADPDKVMIPVRNSCDPDARNFAHSHATDDNGRQGMYL